MSGGVSGWVLAAAAVVGAVSSIQNGQAQKKAASESAKLQERANAQAKDAALKQEKMADESTNRANQKTADVQGIVDAAEQAGKGGASGTMLTGAQGVDPNLLNLGKSTLLG